MHELEVNGGRGRPSSEIIDPLLNPSMLNKSLQSKPNLIDSPKLQQITGTWRQITSPASRAPQPVDVVFGTGPISSQLIEYKSVQVQTGSTINLSYIRHITILQTPISHRKMVQHKSTQTEPCDVPLPMVDSEGL